MSSQPRGMLTPRTEPGVSRFDVICQPGIVDTVLDLTSRWADDRALPENARRRLGYLLGAAVEHGTRFEPRALTMLVRWVGVERVRIDLRWYGGTDAARQERPEQALAGTIATLDALATEWGLGHNGSAWIQWIVADVS